MAIELPPSAAPLDALPASALPGHVAAKLHALAAGEEPVSAYLYDPGVAAARARALRAALPGWAEVCYAVKANSFPPVLAALASGVDGFEVASVTEIALAQEAAAAAGRPARLVASGPGKSAPLLAALVEAGVEVVNVESVLELHRLNAAAVRAGRRVPVALRVNPARVPVTGSLHMGGTATQFGVPEADVPEALAVARALPGLDVVGFHVHAVCNNLDAAAHVAYVRWCLDWSARTAAAHGVDLRVVDVGGGIGVAFGGEDPFDLAVFGELMAGVRPPAGVRVVFEPGRWLVADCGYYAAEVTDLKHAYGTWFAVLRGGIHHFQLPTSWEIAHNFAVLPVDAWPHPFPRPEVRDTPVTVVGELCTPEDTLARDVTVSRIRAGDVVVFPNAGSYGWEFAMHEFLGHPRAPRIALGDGAG
ncbi:diaminopimelate decarboxylase [Carbonactinospora thermoautotrophica]|nr:alanine racemase [Carbonactinospora thermoautotrophica]MCX9190988.1 diaminopimelate decarboxylase [Carbonactinospora thermoautotrophica]